MRLQALGTWDPTARVQRHRHGRRRVPPPRGARRAEAARREPLLRGAPEPCRGRRGGRRAARRAARGRERGAAGPGVNGVISADTTIARVLEEHPSLLDVLAGYHGHFERLRNRLLRKVMAPRVTVAQAAAIAGVPVDELLGVLRTAVGESGTSSPDAAAPPPPSPGGSAERPAALEALDDAHTV